MSDLQTIIDRRAAATPGPAFAESMTDYSPAVTTWIIPDVIRSKYGNNALNFDEDEGTARFVAAAFTDVPVLTGRLQKTERILATMEDLIDRCAVIPGDFSLLAEDLREALGLGPR